MTDGLDDGLAPGGRRGGAGGLRAIAATHVQLALQSLGALFFSCPS